MENLEKLSDENLILFANKNGGTNEVVGILYNRHRNYLIKVASYFSLYNLNKEDCEDLVQDAFIKIYTNLQTYKEISKVKTWLVKIVMNLCISSFRRNYSCGRNLVAKTHDADFYKEFVMQNTFQDTDYELRKKDFYKILNAQINKMPEKQREVVKARFYEELPYKKIAEKLNIPIGTVRTYLYRGRKILKPRLRNIL